MNTKAKVGIAIAIIAALITIIVVDQKSSKSTQTAQASPAPDTGAMIDQQSGIVLHSSEISPLPQVDPRGGVVARGREELDRVTSGIIKGGQPEIPAGGIKGQELPVDPLPEPPAAETYEVQQGDTLYIIADKKYGDGNLYPLIARANAKVDPNRLRIGQRLVIPARDSKPAAAEIPVVEDGGQKTYIVQAGDTLGEIARHVYKTARRSVIDRIIAANPGIDIDGINLKVGARLALPEIEVSSAPKVEAPMVGPTEGLASMKTYKVLPNDSLWKIAVKFRNGRGITDMMEKLVSANPERLKSTADALQVDWVIAIPE